MIVSGGIYGTACARSHTGLVEQVVETIISEIVDGDLPSNTR